MSNQVQVKLGSSKSCSFYSTVTKKPYTEIQKDKMPWNILNILANLNPVLTELGYNKISLSNSLLAVQPDLAVNEFGESSSLDVLLRDFVKGELVEMFWKGSRSTTPYIKLTKKGRDFFKYNVIA